MNKNYSCDIIKDLLPGYIDGVLSEAGENVVKAHLEECEKCNRAYLEMKEELNNGMEAKEQIALDGFKKLRQHTRKLKIAVGVTTGLLVFLLLFAFLLFNLFSSFYFLSFNFRPSVILLFIFRFLMFHPFYPCKNCLIFILIWHVIPHAMRYNKPVNQRR